MNILMLGNGFDLHHELPTTYICFLKTMEYIINNDVEPYVSVGKIFKEVGKDCTQVFRSYKKYKDIYDDLILNPSIISNINEIGRGNVWLNYFLKTYNQDVGWIDLETEIEMVADTIERLLPLLCDEGLHEIDNVSKLILSYFNFFVEDKPAKAKNTGNMVCIVPHKTDIAKKYLTEYPLGSKVYVCNYDEIINDLYQDLRNLVRLLDLYLINFIDNTLSTQMQSSSDSLAFIKLFNNDNKDKLIVSLNYTHSLEMIYNVSPDKVIHLHGAVGDNNIVLGVNSNIVTKNNYSIKFRKYYQRTMYDTDTQYINFLYSTRFDTDDYKDKIIGQKEVNVLNIFGHSLDVSDRDIIEALFRRADGINIYYHDYIAKDNYIRNLIKIFGKEEFEKLRINKSLGFIKIR